MNTTKRRDGFTLVELAIVLVIIGLLVGGVLVGQDLIKAATVRSTIGDIEKTNAAATTFRTKYSGIPGDLLYTRAAEYGLIQNATVRDGSAAGKGDGNGLVQDCAGSNTALGCETALFWVDLTTAALIPSRLSGYTGATATPTTIAAAAIGDYLPKQKLRDNAYLYVFAATGRNFFGLSAATVATSAIVPAAAVTGGEARSIDEKFDDAMPTTGVVTSMTTTIGTTDTGTTFTASTCMNGTATPKVYNVVDANINTVTCLLQLRTNF